MFGPIIPSTLILALALTALAFLQAQELEVEGNLKVQGNIDASNQRVTNVGSPTDLTDAVNTEFLQDALRDDGNYEYKVFLTSLLQESNVNDIRYYEYQNGVNAGNESSEWSFNFHNVLIPLLTDGWKIEEVIVSSNPSSNNHFFKNLYILKRPISEE